MYQRSNPAQVEQILKDGHGWTPLRGRLLVIYLRNTRSTAKISFFYSWYFRIPPSPPCKVQAQEVLGLFVLRNRFAAICGHAQRENVRDLTFWSHFSPPLAAKVAANHWAPDSALCQWTCANL